MVPPVHSWTGCCSGKPLYRPKLTSMVTARSCVVHAGCSQKFQVLRRLVITLPGELSGLPKGGRVRPVTLGVAGELGVVGGKSGTSPCPPGISQPVEQLFSRTYATAGRLLTGVVVAEAAQ